MLANYCLSQPDKDHLIYQYPKMVLGVGEHECPGAVVDDEVGERAGCAGRVGVGVEVGVGSAHHVDEGVVQRHPVGTHVGEIELGDVHRHAVQPLAGIVRGHLLVLVLVGEAEIDLADPLHRRVAIDLGQRADFQAPVAGNSHIIDDINAK